ncbi:MAG: 23S rRNA (guanosine(2251)-2'-O)-methyltransferase RlmB [bacterium]|nr:23S rRNA (guanosine(2251)-2'-O)-methyltransferase RlmB [bacterium]
MLVYGKNILYEVDKKKIKKAYISRNDYITYLKENSIKYEVVDKSRLDKMVKGVHQGIVLDIFDYNYYTMDDLEGDFVVILDHLTDPHNFGAIIRTCESKNIKSIIIPKDRSVLVNDTVYKTSEGAIDNVKIIMVTNIINAINKLKEQNYFVYCADMDGVDYRKVDYAPKKVLVIGSEGIGISNAVKKNSDVVVAIPMSGKINSLNASVSAGILIYRMD